METRKIGYAMTDEEGYECATWTGADNNVIVNVDTVLNCEYDDPPEPGEQKVIDICREAKSQGIEDVIIFM